MLMCSSKCRKDIYLKKKDLSVLKIFLKRLGLYLYTHKKINEIKLCVFGQKSKNTTTTKQKFKHKSLRRSWELNPLTQSGCVTSAPPSQLRVTI